MKMPSTSWLAALIDSLRSSLSALAGLATLIALSVVVVWPLWYLATTHTQLYSQGIVLLAVTFIVSIIWARGRRFLKKHGSPRASHIDSGIRLTGPEEPRE